MHNEAVPAVTPATSEEGLSVSFRAIEKGIMRYEGSKGVPICMISSRGGRSWLEEG